MCALLSGLPSCSTTEVLFSADDVEGAPLHELIAGEIRAAEQTVHVAIFTFTSSSDRPQIFDALIEAQARGVEVRVCMDAEQGLTVNDGAVNALTDGGVEVGLADGHGGGIMHHKFVVVDSRVVLTGSFNFTKSAEDFNDENLLRLVNADLAAEYEREFTRLAEVCF